jgi:hypothetical protein
MDGVSRTLLESLPLAEGTLTLLSWATQESFLEQVFQEHRGRSYASLVSFSSLVQLIGEALLEHEGSARKALIRSEQREEPAASRQAIYGKLRRIPVELSNALLSHATDRLEEVFPTPACHKLPACLRDYDVIVVDGKKLKNVAKRLKPARAYRGTPLGGKVLAALNLRSGLILAMSAHLDGETNDGPLVPGLLPQIRARTKRPRLYLCDCQFCDLVQTRRFQEDDDHFLLRYHPKNHFHADPERPPRSGVDATQRPYREEWGWLGAPSNKHRRYVRRITLTRPGEEDLILVTDLLDADAYPAAELLETYRLRWSIEQVFQQVTEVFHLQHLISSSPEGTIFQCSFCMLLYNLIQVTRGYIAAAQKRPPATISSELLFYDIRRELSALHTLAERLELTLTLPVWSSARDLKRHLTRLFRHEWQDRWLKSPPKKKPRSPTPKKSIAGGHTSIHRILRDAP